MKPYAPILVILLLVSSSYVGVSYTSDKLSTESFDGKTYYVGGSGPGNYTKIQDAIDNTSDGDTVFVYDDSSPYYENIVVDNSINLVGENNISTIIDGGGNGDVISVHARWVNISGFRVQYGSFFGIKLSTDYNTIKNNLISNNIHGIRHLGGSDENNIVGNIIYNNEHGIFLSSSDSNNITGNIISDNQFGIDIIDSQNNLMRDNNIENNSFNFGVKGSKFSHYLQDIDNSNIINFKPIYYLIEQSNIVVDDSMSIGWIGLISCDNISVKNLKITNNIQGFLIVNTSYCTITNLTLYNNSDGIVVSYSSNNVIKHCHINNTNDDGIHIFDSNKNSISYNIIYNNSCGIDLRYSNNNTIIGNNIGPNNWDGILLSHSTNIVLRNNIMFDNSRNFGVSGDELEEFVNDIDESNKVNGITIYYWIGVENAEVPLDAGYIALVKCNNIMVENLELMNNSQGVLLAETKESTIKGNIITNTDEGIDLYKSNSNTIVNNDIFSNSEYGIRFYESSRNSIKGNNVTSNDHNGIQFYYKSKSNTISGNIVTNSRYGVELEDSNSNTISDNIISNNFIGVYFSCSRFNTIRGNNISNNSYGLFLDGSWWPTGITDLLFGSIFNFIVKNNFIENNLDAFFQNSRINRWKQNYWNRTRILPKLISGEICLITGTPLSFRPIYIPWIPQIDWRPALKPYDI